MRRQALRAATASPANAPASSPNAVTGRVRTRWCAPRDGWETETTSADARGRPPSAFDGGGSRRSPGGPDAIRCPAQQRPGLAPPPHGPGPGSVGRPASGFAGSRATGAEWNRPSGLNRAGPRPSFRRGYRRPRSCRSRGTRQGAPPRRAFGCGRSMWPRVPMRDCECPVRPIRARARPRTKNLRWAGGCWPWSGRPGPLARMPARPRAPWC